MTADQRFYDRLQRYVDNAQERANTIDHLTRKLHAEQYRQERELAIARALVVIKAMDQAVDSFNRHRHLRAA